MSAASAPSPAGTPASSSVRLVVGTGAVVGLVVAAAALSPRLSEPSGRPAVLVCTAAGSAIALLSLVLSGRTRSGGPFGPSTPARGSAPVVVVLAVLVLGALSSTLVDAPPAAATAALSALVVATPFLGGLASSTATGAGLRRTRRLGARFADGAALGQVASADVLVLSAPGLLTTGELQVDQVRADDPDDERTLRWFAGALAHSADDPVARAVRRLAGRGVVTEPTYRPGDGFSGAVDRHPVRVGRPDWLGVDAPGGPGTFVGVEVDGRPLGLLTLVPELVPDAAAHLTRLRRLGVDPRLRAGADRRADHELSARLGVDAATHPDDRADAAADDGRVIGLVVDDLVTDSPTADVVIARSASAQPVALDLGGGDVGTLASALGLARSSREAAVTTGWVARVSLVAVPLAALGLIAPLVAAVLALLTAVAVAACASFDPRSRLVAERPVVGVPT